MVEADLKGNKRECSKRGKKLTMCVVASPQSLKKDATQGEKMP
jgi:hypothetical protein